MRNYDLTIEDGVVTWVDSMDAEGKLIPGILYMPEEAVDFSTDAWIALGSEIEGIAVHENNPEFSSAHNCLLSKNGTKLIKACKNSEVHKLTGLKVLGRDALSIMGMHWQDFHFRVPDGVQVLDYRCLALSADTVEITVPDSVLYVNLLAFMIHSQKTHIIFEGDPHLRIGAFGTAAEAEDSGFGVYRSMPPVLYPKAENITVTCKPNSKVAEYCTQYGIPFRT